MTRVVVLALTEAQVAVLLRAASMLEDEHDAARDDGKGGLLRGPEYAALRRAQVRLSATRRPSSTTS